MVKVRQRQPRVRDEKYLDAIRNCICLRCGFHPYDDIRGKLRCDAAHVRYADHRFEKPITGNSTKPDDRWSLPLCPRSLYSRGCHMVQHDWRKGEQDFWESLGIDATMLCYKVSQDYDLGFPVIPWMLATYSESLVRREHINIGRVVNLWPERETRLHFPNGHIAHAFVR